jgi:putative DNA primase/helicase
MLVLEGRQGAGKSTAARVLGGKMFLPKLPNLRDYDRAAHALSGVWIVEVGELDALRGAAATQAKDFISMTSDAYRAPYARYGCTVPRTCIFVGTTNEDGYLGDPTGARRYHPIRVGAVGAVDTKRLERDREQLLAEARSAFERGEEWWPDKEHEEEIEAQQEERYRADEWEAVISRWLEGCRSVRDGVTVGDVLLGAFEMPAEKWDDISQKRVGIAMKRLGWRMERRREGGVKVRRYFRAAGPWTDRAED